MKVAVTTGGRAVARSGLLPRSADELIGYVSRNAAPLFELVKNCADPASQHCDDFAFVMIHAAFSSSEYGGRDLGAKRCLPYQVFKSALDGPQPRVGELMFAPIEDAPVNAAILAMRWVGGEDIKSIESMLNMRSGALQIMFSEAATILRGLSDILYAVTAAQDPSFLPTSLVIASVKDILELVGSIRRLAARLDVGLPEEVIWMTTLVQSDTPLLNRPQIRDLRNSGFMSPESILDTGRFPELLSALGQRSTQTTAFAQSLQSAVRNWRLDERQRLMESQRRRLPAECKELLQKFYRNREKEFETSLEEAFHCLGIAIEAKDDGTLHSFPDLVTSFLAGMTVSIECKSKTGTGSVTFNEATDVIRKASVNGLDHSFKITVCQPYVSPEVPRNLTRCSGLCVVNAEDLAEGLVRMRIGQLSLEAFADWLQRPGQAMRDMLPSPGSVP